jgi:hypothetical protein
MRLVSASRVFRWLYRRLLFVWTTPPFRGILLQAEHRAEEAFRQRTQSFQVISQICIGHVPRRDEFPWTVGLPLVSW